MTDEQRRTRETHACSFDYFDLEVEVSDEGDVAVKFYGIEPRRLVLDMSWDDLREVIDFAAVHGLGMTEPYVVEFKETVEGAA